MLAQSTTLSARVNATPVLVRRTSGAQILSLDGLITIIGSRHGSDLRLTSPDVSGAHAVLVNRGGEVYLHDLLSRSGVFVNDERVDRPTLLRHEDEIRIGRFGFRFETSDTLRRTSPDPSAARQPAYMTIDEQLDVVRLDRSFFVIGRRPGADLVISENTVSSAHAIIVETDGRRFI